MMKRSLFGLFCFLCVFVACKKTTDKENDEIRFEVSEKTNSNQLVYAGQIPCSDCDEIQLILILNIKDFLNGENKYELTTTYKGKNPANTIVQTGTYSVEKGLHFNDSAKVYVLDWDKKKDDRRYFAELDRDSLFISVLSQEGQLLESPNEYQLKLIR